MKTSSPRLFTRRPLLLLATLASGLLLSACATPPPGTLPPLTVTGTARFEGQVVLPANAVLDVSVADVSRADARANTLAQATLPANGAQPLRFSLPVAGRLVQERGSYSVRAEVLVDGKALYVTDSAYLVLGHSGTSHADVLLRPVDTRAQPAAPRIENVRWALVALDGQPLPSQSAATTPYFVLNADGHRVTGSGGCNELVGTYTLSGSALQMLRGPRRELKVCATDMERERALLFALATTEQWAMEGRRLRLLDRLGAQVALFEAQPAP
ncbi:YbaY family lipoprotein [Hydrogenophaga palleronii]|uniref:YbaY family lipoprotein n=1 Tax=Hydrogenophaga palleronii TaxID=65655 RepID=UPI000A00DE09|nr:YbaY family lipoprotein [Hydrogenophaga palleronii]